MKSLFAALLMLVFVLGAAVAAAEPVEVSEGDASGWLLALSLFGNATGESGGFLAVSVFGNSSNASYALSVFGDAEGYFPFSATGTCTTGPMWRAPNGPHTARCAEVAVEDDAEGHYLAISAFGNSSGDVSLSPFGNARPAGGWCIGYHAVVIGAITCGEGGAAVAASATGAAGHGVVAASGTDEARGGVAISGTDDAEGSLAAVSPTGRARQSASSVGMAASVTDSAESCHYETCSAVSAFGAAKGFTAVSACGETEGSIRVSASGTEACRVAAEAAG